MNEKSNLNVQSFKEQTIFSKIVLGGKIIIFFFFLKFILLLSQSEWKYLVFVISFAIMAFDLIFNFMALHDYKTKVFIDKKDLKQ